jgi:hypothetical protein
MCRFVKVAIGCSYWLLGGHRHCCATLHHERSRNRLRQL